MKPPCRGHGRRPPGRPRRGVALAVVVVAVVTEVIERAEPPAASDTFTQLVQAIGPFAARPPAPCIDLTQVMASYRPVPRSEWLQRLIELAEERHTEPTPTPTETATAEVYTVLTTTGSFGACGPGHPRSPVGRARAGHRRCVGYGRYYSASFRPRTCRSVITGASTRRLAVLVYLAAPVGSMIEINQTS